MRVAITTLLSAHLLAGCTWIGGIDWKTRGDTEGGEGGSVANTVVASSSVGGTGGGGAAPSCTLTEAELEVDPSNCGRCGRDCLGGACVDGECGPIMLVDGLIHPTMVVLDDTYVYWNEYYTTSLQRAPKDGSGDVFTIIDEADTNQGGPPYRTLGVSGSTVFWTEYTIAGAVRSVPTTGGSSHKVGPLWHYPSILIDGADVFVAGSDDLGDASVIARMSTVGDGVTILRTVQDQTGIGTLAVDANYVYFTDPPRHVVGRVPRAGGVVQVLDATSVDPAALAVDDTHVYWSDADAIRRKPKDADPSVSSERLTTIPLRCYSIVLDAASVYFEAPDFDNSSGIVGRVAKEGIEQKPHLYGHPGEFEAPGLLAADDVAVYWPTSFKGEIWRVAK